MYKYDWQHPPVTDNCVASNSSGKGKSKAALGCEGWLNPPICSPSCRTSQRKSSAASAEPEWQQPPVTEAVSHKDKVANKRALQLDQLTLPEKRACVRSDVAPHWLQPEVVSSTCLWPVPKCMPKKDIHLTLGMILLATLHQNKDKSTRTKFERTAMEEKANAERLAKPSCKCRCGLDIKKADLVAFNGMFNSIPAADRSEILRHAYADAGCAEESVSAKWHFLGSQVCLRRLCQLLQCSPNTLYGTYLHGKQDGRRQNRSESDSTVDLFLLELYNSAAETLPEEPGIINVSEAINKDENGVVLQPVVSGPRQAALISWDPSGNVQDQLRALGSGNVQSLPPRYLQKQRISDLWWQYQASAPEGQKTVCYRMFCLRFSRGWGEVLKFRMKSQHAQCTQCSKYSNTIHYARCDPATRQAAAENWNAHLLECKHNRHIYWKARWLSKRRDGQVLTIIIDSMDKAKCTWPQYTFRQNKELELLAQSGGHRPKLVITAAIAHGYCVDFYVAEDEEMFHGASNFCEVLCRTIDRVWNICKRKGLTFPKHLWIQADNTTAQAKNEEVAKLLAYFVGRFKFQTASLNFLTVGHTHEDIDQLFGMLYALVLRRIRFKVPAELIRAIEAGMAPAFFGLLEVLGVFSLTHVRNFKSWLDQTGVHLVNCWVTRFPDRSGNHEHKVTAPHSFTYKLRMDLTASEAAQLSVATSAGEPTDVFCLVKAQMCSTQLNSAPVLVLRRSGLSRILSLAPTGLY